MTLTIPVPVPLTRCSILQEERERITKVGGVVEFHGCWRVSHPNLNMRLAVSRSFGDPGFKGLKVPPWVRAHLHMIMRYVKREKPFCKRVVSERDHHKGTG